jgi:hypothetical protein
MTAKGGESAEEDTDRDSSSNEYDGKKEMVLAHENIMDNSNGISGSYSRHLTADSKQRGTLKPMAVVVDH